MLNTTVKDVHIRLWPIFMHPFANVKWFPKQWVNWDPKQFTHAWNICVYIARKGTLDWKLRTGLTSELRFNVPGLLKGRAFAVAVHLYLEGVVSRRCYLLSLTKNNEQPYNITLLLSVSEFYLLWRCAPPISSWHGWAVLCKGAEAKPQLFLFMIFGAPRVELQLDYRDYSIYHLKYGIIKCKCTAFCLGGREGRQWYFPDTYCLLWASALDCR